MPLMSVNTFTIRQAPRGLGLAQASLARSQGFWCDAKVLICAIRLALISFDSNNVVIAALND